MSTPISDVSVKVSGRKIDGGEWVKRMEVAGATMAHRQPRRSLSSPPFVVISIIDRSDPFLPLSDNEDIPISVHPSSGADTCRVPTGIGILDHGGEVLAVTS